MTEIRRQTPVTAKKILFVAAMLFFVCRFAYSQQNPRYALVIGNQSYTEGPLQNPENDAEDMAEVLQELGFTVDLLTNGNLTQMENSVIRLRERLSADKSAYGFFFYAGHGIQSNGTNYLIPVDVNLPSESFLRERALSVQAMLAELNDAGNELNVVVLDACRSNPYTWGRDPGIRNRGLTVVSNQPADSIIVYATSAGSVAADGQGDNGLFTSHLLTHLATPGIEILEVFRRTGAAVSNESGKTQIPAVYSQFFGTAYLGGIQENPYNQVPVAASAPQGRVPSSMVQVRGGTFVMGSPSGENARESDEHEHEVTLGPFLMAKYPVTQREWTSVMGSNPSYFTGDNLPVEGVSWYDAVEYCNRLSRAEGLTPAYTINGVEVTWNRGANGYRLPTEAEWEFACRAGTSTAYHGGSPLDDMAWYGANSGDQTHPVGGKQPNGFGIYDMHGNVWEWCWDWYGYYSRTAEENPAGPPSGINRILRGGAWSNSSLYLRSANRDSDVPSGRNYFVGFRVVRQ